MLRRAIVVGASLLVATAASIAAPAAGAKTARSVYPSEGVGQVTSAGAWAGSTSSRGLCLQSLTCPLVKNSAPGGGVGGAGDGYLRTDVGSLLGVGASSTGAWQSRSFVYHGADGRAPKVLTFRLFRRTDDATLLRVAGNDAYFTAAIVNAKSGNAVVEPFHHQALTPRSSWTKFGPKRLVRHVLRRGHSYRIRVTSTFVNGAEVVPGASTGYDNFQLVAKRHLRRHRHHHR